MQARIHPSSTPRSRAARLCVCFGLLIGTASAQSLGDDLVSYFPLDDGIFNQSEREAGDLKEANTIVVTAPDESSPWLSGSNAKFRGSLMINGEDTYGEVPDSASLDIGTDAVTLALWVRIEQLPSELEGGFGAIYDSEGDQYVIYLDKGSNELRFKVTATGGAQRPGIPAADLVKNQWLHVAGVYDGAESRIYLNGELKDTHTGPTGDVNPGQIAGIARNGIQETSFFRGAVDEIGIWSRALSQEDIAMLVTEGILSAFDSDEDGLRDDWEMSFFGNLDAAADGDPDGDLLTNDKEYEYGADPTETDSDGDDLDDFAEVTTHMSDPVVRDSDGDGLEDGSEVNDTGTSPILADTDGDGLDDPTELGLPMPTNPLVADSDGDDLSDGDEVNFFLTDPLKADSDDDTFADSQEVRDGGDANDAAIVPRMVRLGLASDLVSLWTFDDNVTAATDTQVRDALAQNNLELVSPAPEAAWLADADAKLKRSLHIDGAATYVPVPNSPSLDSGSEMLTIALWVKLDQLPADIESGFAGIFDSVEDSYVIYLDKGNDELRFKVSATGAERPGIPATQLSLGQWLHIAGVYDGVAGTAKIYLNAALVDTHNNVTGAIKAGQVAAIGRNGAENTSPFSGAVDDLAIWNRALQDDEIGVLFSGIPLENADFDRDGLADEWETLFLGNLDEDGDDNRDDDGATNSEEFAAGTNPTLPDSDGDGLTDGEEIKELMTDPLDTDSDDDTYSDSFEVRDEGDPNDETVIPRLADLGVAEGLISFWNMNDPVDSRAVADVTGRNPLMLSEDAPDGTRLVSDEAKFGSSLALDGFEAYVDVPNSPSLNPDTTTLTLTAWVRLNELPETIIGSFAGIFDSTNDAYVLYLDKGNNELRFKVTATGAERPGIPADALATDEWLHIAGVYDGDASMARIYLNGELMDTHGGPTGPVITGQIAAMGRNGNEETGFFEGAIDDVGVWNVALTEQQIASLFRNTPTDPNDLDADGLPDEWEIDNFGNLDRDGSGDFENDGLTDAEEFEAGTSPQLADTDEDGASDAYEVTRGTNPLDNESTPIPEGTGLAAGLTAFWPFDDALENPGATQVDDATGVNPLQLTFDDPEGFWLAEPAAKRGGALLINGVDSFVTVPSSKSLDIGGDAVSISAWVRLAELPSEMAEGIGAIYDSSNDAYVLYLDRGNAELRFKVTATGAERPGIPEANLILDEWIHIVGVYDGSMSEARIYLNGELMDTHAGPTGAVSTGQVAGIGRNGTDEASFLNGAVDEIAIWTRALLPEEVADLAAGALILGGEAPTTEYRIVSIKKSVGDTELGWTSETDKTYRVEFNPTLAADGWITIEAGVAADKGNITTYTDTTHGAATEGYYRIVRE